MKACLLSLISLCLVPYGYGQEIESKSITIVIEDIPNETPHDASFYLAGSCCDWNPYLDSNKFKKRPDGSFALTISPAVDTFQYKITRGNWQSVEGQKNGRARENRLYIRAEHGDRISLKVESWEDISKGSYLFFMYSLLLAAIQGVVLILAIHAIGSKANVANQSLIHWIGIILLAIIGRASTYEPIIFNWQPKLILVPELILFSCAPLFFRYVQKLSGQSLGIKRHHWLLTLPTVLQLVIYLPMILMEKEGFRFLVLDHKLNSYFALFGLLSFLFNSGFWIKIKISLNKLESQNPNKQQLKDHKVLSAFLNTLLIYLGLWFCIIVLGICDLFTSEDLGVWVDTSLDVFWFFFSLIIFIISYILVKDPDVVKRKVSYQNTEIDTKEMSPILIRLKHLLEEDKAFTNPLLTLSDLAHQIPTSSHMLSRVVNEHYKKSFSGLINQYRIDAFIAQVNNQDTDSYLSTAFAVGFNSKATFNRAFKKETNQTPRSYFNDTK